MRIEQSSRDGCAILAPVGALDLTGVVPLRQTLLKRLSERPLAVICDLSGLSSAEPACAMVFATVASHPASHWPETSLLLCGARPAVAAVLDRQRTEEVLPVYPTLEDALACAVARPPYLRAELPLGPSATAAAAARRFVRDTCWYWRLDKVDGDDTVDRRRTEDLVDRAVLVASELVTNAVVHAKGPLRLRLQWRRERLHVAVYDGLPRLLRLAGDPGDLETEDGRGLLIVDQLASRWGVHHPRRGGKAVWCVLER